MSEKVLTKDLQEFKIKVCDILNILNKYEFCKNFYEQLNFMAFDIQETMENNLEK